MIKRPIYLDYAATTPVDPVVADAMMACLTLDGNFANPASRSHLYGWKAEEAVELGRQQVADLIAADPREIVWTSGATEANNLAIKGIAQAHAKRGRHLITSKIEHKAVLDCFRYLETQGFEVTWLQPDAEGVIAVSQLEAAWREDTLLVSLMHVNNELGSINDIAELGAWCRQRGVFFHVDAAQSFGKLAIDLRELPVDLMSFSAHKIYGPKGVGALYVRQQPRVRLEAQIHGGGHERGMRSGTLPTHQIVGMGKAAQIAGQVRVEEQARIAALRHRFWAGIRDLAAVRLNAAEDKVLPGILNLAVAGCEGEHLLMALNQLALSTGSACTSASLEPSYVLRAIGLDDALAHASLRMSFGRFTTEEEIDFAITHFRQVVTQLSRVTA